MADLVSHALGPLVEGRSPAEIEVLRVLDPACGSAHFLVEAMRFLGRALHRAYALEHGGKAPPHFRSTTGQGWDADWQTTDEDARARLSEARAWCKRRIAERCLFGVDLNPTAVTLAHVSLWIESVAGDRPLTYFEHHVRCGNSLLGSFVERLARPPFDEKDKDQRQAGIYAKQVRDAVREAAGLRRLIDSAPTDALAREGIDPESVGEQEYKDCLRRRADATLGGARMLFDLRSAALFLPGIWHDWYALADHVADPATLEAEARQRSWWDGFVAVRDRERFFHWELEFPEVFLDA
ncbi:MAG: Eco57I restriction-modification methylase domain-containing protein, partial [Candidatus Rokuibacteriota bacterium]